MSKVKEDAIKLIEGMPDDRVFYAIQVLQGPEGLFERPNLKKKQEAYDRLKKMQVHALDFNKDKELAEYREEKYALL